MSVALAALYHDPDGRMCDQIERALPILDRVFSGLTVRASRVANKRGTSLFANAGAQVHHETSGPENELPVLGAVRRQACTIALDLNTTHVLYCDTDRILHWAEHYPDELADVVDRVPDDDLTIIGRTTRAFDTHPRAQRDTEAIVNHLFHAVTGHDWDLLAAARGLSRRAVEAIASGCPDDRISTDSSWPLYLLHQDGYSIGYVETEGMEFETPSRFGPEIQAAGGYDAWIAQRDADPASWLLRMDFARHNIQAIHDFVHAGRG